MRNKKYWFEELGEGWASVLKDTLRSPYMDKLMNFVDTEYALAEVFPVYYDNLFRAFRLCSWDKVRIVMIGEEPNNFTGTSSLAFADSLIHSHHNATVQAIANRIADEYYDGLNLNFDYTLEDWANQGILLLNQSITSRMNEKGAHIRPWNKFILAVIEALNDYRIGTIFFLWGENTKNKFLPLLNKHHVFDWEHPYEAAKQYRNWECPNFKEADKLLTYLNGNQEKINW